MIVPDKKGGFQVKSRTGKPLSKPGVSKAAAEQRLAQVERFATKVLPQPKPDTPFPPKMPKKSY